MQLFFDSGATKCDCILLDEEGRYVSHISDRGINASYMADAEMAAIFRRMRADIPMSGSFSRITFSGAGCGNPANAERVRNAMKDCFQSDIIDVVSDLMGACRLLCAGKKGIVAILGTGASACSYDGHEIVCQAPSLGYMLGDEGSGSYLGKLLMQSYLKNQIPDDVRLKLEQHFQLTPAKVLQHVYREASPNLFFASFAVYLHENKAVPFYANLLTNAFHHFFQQQIDVLQPLLSDQLFLMGSVGYYFQQEIAEVAAQHHFKLTQAVASPLSLLTC